MKHNISLGRGEWGGATRVRGGGFVRRICEGGGCRGLQKQVFQRGAFRLQVLTQFIQRATVGQLSLIENADAVRQLA